MKKCLFFILALGLWVVSGGCNWRQEISVDTELDNLSDVMAFGRKDQGVSDMFSSYDRQGGNVDWYFFPPPLDGKELYALTTLEGPGCLTRIWMTNIPVTEWLFYFDGETDARLKLATSDLFTPSTLFNPLQGGGQWRRLFLFAPSLCKILEDCLADAGVYTARQTLFSGQFKALSVRDKSRLVASGL